MVVREEETLQSEDIREMPVSYHQLSILYHLCRVSCSYWSVVPTRTFARPVLDRLADVGFFELCTDRFDFDEVLESTVKLDSQVAKPLRTHRQSPKCRFHITVMSVSYHLRAVSALNPATRVRGDIKATVP
jgi:hypothetical protein